MLPLADLHLLRPWWLIALLPALLLLVALWRQRGEGGVWQKVCDAELLPHLLLGLGGRPRRLPLILLGLGWLLAVVAISGPVWERQPQPLYQTNLARVVVLDLSPSMNAQDLKPSRLERARFKLQDILRQSREGRTALVVFGGEPHLVVPLTDDTATIEVMVSALSVDIVPAEGDRLLPALELAAELLRRGSNGKGEILLISDGVADMADSLPRVARWRDQGLRLSVLAVGTLEGAPVPGAYAGGQARISRLNLSGLKGLAGAGGGGFSELSADNSDLQQLLNRPVSRAVDQASAQQSGVERWVEQGPWLLLPVLLLALAGARRGWLGVLFVVLLLPPPPAEALEWKDLWSRPDQQGAAALAAGDLDAASQLFQQPQWRAAARYQAGDYQGAVEEYKGQTGGDALYNRGNALARSGQLKQALESYDAALELQPEDEDARFNRQLVEQLQQQRQQEQRGNGQGGSQTDQGEQPQPGEEGAPGEQSGEGQQSPQDGASAAEPSPADNGGSGEAQSAPQQDKGGEAAEVQDPADGDGDQPRSEATAAGEQAGVEDLQDEAAAARQDVAPQAEGKGLESSSTAPQTGESELALEQWLRQVPDDPAGLLRRKFMLEHLQRQRGKE